MHGYAICYDLSDDRVRDRAARRLLRHGLRVQESVYEVWFRAPSEFEQLLRELRALLPPAASLRWYRLTENALQDSGSLDANPPRRPPVAVIW